MVCYVAIMVEVPVKMFVDSTEHIVTILNKDGVILYPTDTIWGLGCSIYSQKGVEKIYEIKQRDRNNPLLLLVDGISMLKKYAKSIHPRVETLHVYHKQPLTIIYEAGPRIPQYLLGDNKTIAIRIVQDEFCKSLINLLGYPITSSSANISHKPYPKIFSEIEESILNQSDYVVSYKQKHTKKGSPSVIAKFGENGDLEFLRT